ncbi:MAG: hypothetical protein ACREFQ_12655 [Stellaceae bacterium]
MTNVETNGFTIGGGVGMIGAERRHDRQPSALKGQGRINNAIINDGTVEASAARSLSAAA